MIFQSERQLRTLRFPVGDKRPPRGGQTGCSWGTNGVLVGDKRDPRRGLTGTPFAASVECVDYQLFAEPLKKEQELANRIARESTVSPADTHAVLRALPDIMADFMKESRAIHIEGLGWFRYTTVAAGNGVENKEDVSSDQITGLRVQFTPDRTRNLSGGYTRALIADEGVTFMEWLGKDSDETQIPDDNDDEGQTENPLG